MARAFVFLLSACLFLAVTSPAAGQIYVSRDTGGSLVLSDRPLDPRQTTYEVDGTTYRASRPRHTAGSRLLYDGLIERHAAEYDVRADLVRAVIQVESGFNPRARSPKGALGLMQLMPATAAELGVLNPYDPAQNIRGGVAYLGQLLDRYDGNEELALAAYNAGPEAVARYGGTVPPYRETRNYLAQIRARTGRLGSRVDSRIYGIVEMVGGRPVTRYTNRPAAGADEIVSARRR